MQPVKVSTLSVGRRFGRIQIFGFAVRIEGAAAKRNWFSLSIEDRKHQPSPEPVVRTAAVLLDDQTTLLERFLRGALLTQVGR